MTTSLVAGTAIGGGCVEVDQVLGDETTVSVVEALGHGQGTARRC